MKRMVANLLVVILGIVLAGLSAASAAEPNPPTPSTGAEPGEQEPPSDEAVPIRMFHGRVVSIPARLNGGKPLYYALIRWDTGPDCTNATAQAGTFDRIDVSLAEEKVKLAMFLRGGVANTYGGTPVVVDGRPGTFVCDIQTKTFVRLVPLPKSPPNGRLVDGACNCPLPAMPKGQANRLLTTLQAR